MAMIWVSALNVEVAGYCKVSGLSYLSNLTIFLFPALTKI